MPPLPSLTSAQIACLRIAAVLWVIWGLVHALAGILVITGDTASGFQAIADAVDPSTLQMDYPAAAGAILGQHGFNLFWIGLVTFISAFYIWNGGKNSLATMSVFFLRPQSMTAINLFNTSVKSLL